MSLRTIARASAIGAFPAILAGYMASRPQPAELRLSVAALHAATLTSARSTGEAADSPFLLVSILGPQRSTATVRLPATGQLSIHRDEALAPRPLTDLRLQPGDSIRILISVLEGRQVRPADEAQAASASVQALAEIAARRSPLLASALAPVTKEGGHWLGSAILLLTNENGAAYWRALDCIATCKVLKAPAGTVLAPFEAQSIMGVVELTGGGGTYHLELQGQRTS